MLSEYYHKLIDKAPTLTLEENYKLLSKYVKAKESEKDSVAWQITYSNLKFIVYIINHSSFSSRIDDDILSDAITDFHKVLTQYYKKEFNYHQFLSIARLYVGGNVRGNYIKKISQVSGGIETRKSGSVIEISQNQFFDNDESKSLTYNLPANDKSPCEIVIDNEKVNRCKKFFSKRSISAILTKKQYHFFKTLVKNNSDITSARTELKYSKQRAFQTRDRIREKLRDRYDSFNMTEIIKG